MSQQQAVLRSERLVLEPLSMEHAERIFPLFMDPSLYRWMPVDPPISVDFLATRYKRIAQQSTGLESKGRWLNWFARLPEDDEYVAMVETTLNDQGEVTLAYFVFAAYQGYGYGTEACRMVLDHLAQEYGARVAIAEIDTRNRPSIALAERLGFQRVGFKADADFFKGESSDEYVFKRSLMKESA